MKKRILLLAFTALTLGMNAQELPENAEAGKCYIKCITADEFNDVTETIQISPSYKKLRTIPATFKTIEEEVLIKEASVKKIYVPAVYETVIVDVTPDNKAFNYEVVPAKFGKDKVTIEVMPKTGKWEYTQLKNCPSANKDECMVACFVEHPAKHSTVYQTTLVSDATVNTVPISDKLNTYKKQVIKEPARVEDVVIPAIYGTIKKVVVDQPAKVLEEVIPAESKTITKTVLTKKGGMTVWEMVDCNVAKGINILPINYDLNSALITDQAAEIIDNNLLKLMKEKSALRVEVMSHTDSRSNDEYNMALSQQRAQAVVNYLVSKGISRNRLVAKGFGETRIKNECKNDVPCTDEQHLVNRRTEFRIIR